ncbi:hypothetical protein EN871_11830 [bacterium M00.F.Ca.ET.228.01.1.1]|nr:hypothetical protein EN871_11830 [bacterium M00.F.Ca.ET.228.01.1.1]TGS01392.1 hypothetical protein EN834_11825 [bacterium M00.F.Ca.ET.191.01.1.1]TGU09002.1 hypothetical protein EN798_07705 [bacterium M00.F.Ca.ET.155.01.1.1]
MVKATRFARQGSRAGHPGAGLILSRFPAAGRFSLNSPDGDRPPCLCGKRTDVLDVDKLSEISQGLTAHALSVPGFSLQHNISKSLRCYKGDTLCKPLFCKTVLQ